MTDPASLAMALFLGMVLGLLFYGGLYLTLPRALVSQRGPLWLTLSLMLRLALIGLGLAGMARHHPTTLLAGFSGTILARGALLRPIVRTGGRCAPQFR